MNSKMRVVCAVLAVATLGAVAGCDKASSTNKKPETTTAQPAPNTTDSK